MESYWITTYKNGKLNVKISKKYLILLNGISYSMTANMSQKFADMGTNMTVQVEK